jgi:hypothetical protein
MVGSCEGLTRCAMSQSRCHVVTTAEHATRQCSRTGWYFRSCSFSQCRAERAATTRLAVRNHVVRLKYLGGASLEVKLPRLCHSYVVAVAMGRLPSHRLPSFSSSLCLVG